jgi:hypothetical protein
MKENERFILFELIAYEKKKKSREESIEIKKI